MGFLADKRILITGVLSKHSIAYGIAGNTICPLGEAAAWPMMGFITKFRPDFEARLAKSRGLPPAGYHGAHP